MTKAIVTLYLANGHEVKKEVTFSRRSDAELLKKQLHNCSSLPQEYSRCTVELIDDNDAIHDR